MRLIIYLLALTFLSEFMPEKLKDQSISVAALEKLLLIQNMPNQLQVPRNFRAADDYYLMDRLQQLETVPTREGLDKLSISGSSQFSQQGLQAILTQIPSDKNLVIVDLRQESHGFINGIATSWYGERDWANIGKTSQQINQDEWSLLTMVKQSGQVMIYTDKYATDSLQLNIDSVETEEDLAAEAKLSYKRFYVTDHKKPSDLDVKEFLEFVNHLPKNSWLHFHCAAGKGRTTTFMVMFDIYQNAKTVSFEDIIKRQWLIGGRDLSQLPESEWKLSHAAERYAFLKYFYEYCRAEANLTSQSWVHWINAESFSATAAIAQLHSIVRQ